MRAFLDPGGFDAGVWTQLAGELGLAGLRTPESHGGLGLGVAELGVVMEAMGAELYNGPFFSSICLATTMLLKLGSNDLLPDLATGERTATLAYAEADGPFDGPAQATHWDGSTVTGVKSPVVDGADADDLLVTAASPDGGMSLVLVPGGGAGVTRRRLPAFDQTRGLASVTFDAAPGRLLGTEGGAAPALRRTLQEASVLLAAEQLGGAQRCLDTAVGYAKLRQQFGRSIGSFQAIKHLCADTLVAVESARSAVSYALAATDSDGDLAEPAGVARSQASEVFCLAAKNNLQVHGGIGFTWEHDAHLYLKRAKSSEVLLGTPAEHRERIAQAIGI